MKKFAFTLLELVASLGIFAFVMGAIFLAFTHSTRTFQHSVLRQGLQGDSLRLESLLGRDVRMTDYHSTFTVARDYTMSGGRMVRRDGLSMAALSNWDDNSKFDSVTGLPRWDQQIVYYASNDSDQGKLFRQVIGGGGTTGLPYFALGSNLNADPNLNSSVLNTTGVSDQVDSFEVLRDDGTQGLLLILRVRRVGTRRRSGGEEKVDETLETRYSITARNTFPKL